MQLNPTLQNVVDACSYLFNLELNQTNLDQFKNIKYVIMQGSSVRAEKLASKLSSIILGVDMRFFKPLNLTKTSNFVIYRVGSVLSVSHGMGCTAIDSLLHGITKLLYLAGNDDLKYLRIGTSGGIGIEPGNVIITEQAFMPDLSPYWINYELDRQIKTPTKFDSQLINDVMAAQPHNIDFSLIKAHSIAADDFYLGQCRYDGAIPSNKDHAWRQEFFAQIHALGIRNFEMESSALAAFCHRAQIPATMIATTIVNRMKSDQVTASAAELDQFADNAQQVAINYLLAQLS